MNSHGKHLFCIIALIITLAVSSAAVDCNVYAASRAADNTTTKAELNVVPTVSKVSIAKSIYAVNERVTFNITANGAVTHLWIYCPNGDTLTYKNVGSSYTLPFGMSGHFEALVQTWNGSENKISPRISWHVGLPQKAKLVTNKTDYNANEKITFTFDTDGTSNALVLYYPNGESTTINGITVPYTLNLSADGEYQALVRTTNTIGSRDSNTVTFRVHDKGIGSVTIPAGTYVYRGSEIYPSLKVLDIYGNELSSEFYNVEITNNRNVGKATIIVNGDGGYNGSITKTFTIKPAKPVIKSMTPGRSKLTVKMSTKPASKGAAAYQIGYRLKGTTKWKTATTTLQSKTIYKLKKGKRYQIRVRSKKTVGGTTYYSAWSAIKTSLKVK